MELIDYLRLSRELTGSSKVEELMTSARYLEAQMSIQPDKSILSTDWMTVRNAGMFLPYVDILHPINGSANWAPYAFQARMAKTLDESEKKVALIKTARQMGTSMTLGALAFYKAVTRPDHNVLVLANKFASALDNMGRISHVIKTCRLPIPKITEFNKSCIRFENGSQIIARATTGNSARGTTIDTLIVHDAAYIPWGQEDEWWANTQPALRPDHQIILMSTPNKTRGLFYNMWQEASTGTNPEFLQLSYTWRDHPCRDDNWAKAMRAQMSAESFAQEYEGQFLEHKV